MPYDGSLRRLFKHERLVSTYMPLDAHLLDDVVILRNRSLLAMFEFEGFPWETQPEDEIVQKFLTIVNTLHNIADPTITLHVYNCRGMANPNIFGQRPPGTSFADRLDTAYIDNLFNLTLYRNSIFIGIEIAPPQYLGALVGKNDPNEESIDSRLDRLESICGLLQFNLAVFKPRRLGMREDVFSEIAETLVYAMTGFWRPIQLTTGRLGQSMFSEDVWCWWETIEFRSPGPSWFAAAFGQRHYLKKTHPGKLDSLLSAPFCHTLYQSYQFIQTQKAQTAIDNTVAHRTQGKDRAVTETEDLTRRGGLADELGSQHQVLGDHCLTLLVFADDATALRKAATAAWGLLSNTGGTISRENFALEAVWASLCPGNKHYRPRPGNVSSLNFACLSTLHTYPRGKLKGYWGDPIAWFRITSGEAYPFHLHVEDVGNLFITGKIGSGKSTMIGFLAAQLVRRGNQVIIWDKDRGLKILVHHLGGIYLELRNPTGLAPLKALTDSAEDIDFLAGLITACIRSDDGPGLTAEESRRLYLGLRQVMTLPPEDRWLEEVRALLGVDADGAGARLEKWCHGRELGWIIDNPKDLMRFDAPVVAMDKTFILDHKQACAPVMSVLYYYTNKLIDGRRIAFFDDEAHKSFSIKTFEDLLNDLVKARSRKGNCPTILSTQSPRDGLRSGMGHTIKEQFPSHMAFAPGEASWEDFGPEGLGYTRAEFEIIQNLSNFNFLLRQDRVSVRAQLPLQGLDDFIAVMSGRSTSVKLFDGIMAEYDGDMTKVSTDFKARWREEAAV